MDRQKWQFMFMKELVRLLSWQPGYVEQAGVTKDSILNRWSKHIDHAFATAKDPEETALLMLDREKMRVCHR